METSMQHRLVRLGAEQLFSIDGAAGRCLVVFQGKVWITQEGDLRDHVVQSGESFSFDRAGLALVEALEPSSLAVLGETTDVPEAIGYEAAYPIANATQRPSAVGPAVALLSHAPAHRLA
jgi:hypothetical protein